MNCVRCEVALELLPNGRYAGLFHGELSPAAPHLCATCYRELKDEELARKRAEAEARDRAAWAAREEEERLAREEEERLAREERELGYALTACLSSFDGLSRAAVVNLRLCYYWRAEGKIPFDWSYSRPDNPEDCGDCKDDEERLYHCGTCSRRAIEALDYARCARDGIDDYWVDAYSLHGVMDKAWNYEARFTPDGVRRMRGEEAPGGYEDEDGVRVMTGLNDTPPTCDCLLLDALGPEDFDCWEKRYPDLFYPWRVTPSLLPDGFEEWASETLPAVFDKMEAEMDKFLASKDPN